MKAYTFDIDGHFLGVIEDFKHQTPLFTFVEPIFSLNTKPQWNGVQWNYNQVIVTPELTITNITTSVQSIVKPDFSEITCPLNTIVTASVEMNVPANASFRMPIKSSDGREIYTMLNFVDGKAEVVLTFNSSGKWIIEEAGINSALADEEKLSFRGITVYVTM